MAGSYEPSVAVHWVPLSFGVLFTRNIYRAVVADSLAQCKASPGHSWPAGRWRASDGI